jgi:hypothetical protein
VDAAVIRITNHSKAATNEAVGVDENGGKILGGSAAPVAYITGIAENSLKNFLDVLSFFGEGFLTDVIEGSPIKKTFTAQAGETLSSAWNFLINESIGDNSNPDFNDFAFANVSNNSGLTQNYEKTNREGRIRAASRQRRTRSNKSVLA